jgi:CubicO group peptidase (beta-lactamase class C family)
MYTCLGFVVEAVSGLLFESFVQANILDPLEMTRGVLTQDAFDNDPADNKMTGYLFQPQGDRVGAKSSDLPIGDYLQAPGGLYISMNEMLNYAQCLLNNGEYKGKQILSAESVATLFSPQINAPYGEGDNPQYALGWSIEAKSDNTPYVVIQHGGGMGTSNSFLLLVPELKLAVVAAENAGTGIAPLASRMAVATVLGQDPEQVIEDFKIAKALEEITGTYKSAYDMYSLTVSRKGGVLQVDMETDDGSFSFPLIPSDLDNLEFALYSLKASSKAKVVFYRNKQTGRVEHAAYDRFLYQRK